MDYYTAQQYIHDHTRHLEAAAETHRLAQQHRPATKRGWWLVRLQAVLWMLIGKVM